ncbi:MAG: hypothetical protein M1815_005255 [Lichina confinis]|nr:MAG: hypothetical protein M1815_005255 [Lichina confinis]
MRPKRPARWGRTTGVDGSVGGEAWELGSSLTQPEAIQWSNRLRFETRDGTVCRGKDSGPIENSRFDDERSSAIQAQVDATVRLRESRHHNGWKPERCDLDRIDSAPASRQTVERSDSHLETVTRSCVLFGEACTLRRPDPENAGRLNDLVLLSQLNFDRRWHTVVRTTASGRSVAIPSPPPPPPPWPSRPPIHVSRSHLVSRTMAELLRNRQHSHPRRRWISAASPIRLGLLLAAMIMFVGTVVAAQAIDRGTVLQATLDRLARRGEILVDTRPPPSRRAAVPHLQRRQLFNNPTSSSSAAEESSTSASSPSSGPSDSPAQSTSDTDPNAANSPMPTAFDSNLGDNFTANSCSEFFETFLANPQFEECLPFSLLLQNSNSFFQAERSFFRITQVLEEMCNVDFDACSGLMGQLARDIRRNANCGDDYADGNPLVVQAYNGMQAYAPLYEAGCHKSSSGSYCFADAITNSASPGDAYVYFVALGSAMPGGSRPTCTSCLQDTMATFAAAASNDSQPVHENYASTAQLINLGCGPNFVNATIPPPSSSWAISTPVPSPLIVSFSTVLASLMLVVLRDWIL